MNSVDRITFTDIEKVRRVYFKMMVGLFSAFTIIMISKPLEWKIGLTLLGFIIVPIIISLIIKHFQGTLASIEVSADALIFNYVHLLSNQIKCKRFKFHDITKIEYSGSFLNRLTVISKTEKLYINIDDSEKPPIKALVETVNRKRGVSV